VPRHNIANILKIKQKKTPKRHLKSQKMGIGYRVLGIDSYQLPIKGLNNRFQILHQIKTTPNHIEPEKSLKLCVNYVPMWF
jgi:hypothetical protein